MLTRQRHAPAHDNPLGRSIRRIHAANVDAPEVVDLAWRARGLAAPGAGAATAAPAAGGAGLALAAGDHDLNPQLAPQPDAAPRQAAVLMLVGADDAGTLCVLLTERSAHLSAHAGQIALPGGKIEPGESAIEAATREAHEEVGLLPDAISIAGVAPHYLTRTGFLVTPILAIATADAPLRLDPGEVADAFLAPYAHLMSPNNHKEVKVATNGTSRTYYEIMVGERRIWGVTAGILRLINENLYAS